MDERDDLYNQIIEEYKKTGSIKQVVENLGSNTIKVRRVLITEGLWSSKSSRDVGELFAQGMSVAEIAKTLSMSEKNVQSYMPYTRGAYGGVKSNDASRSGEYRNRMAQAAENQVSMTSANGADDLSTVEQVDVDKAADVINFQERLGRKTAEDEIFQITQLPSVLRLRFELVPSHIQEEAMGLEEDERKEFLKLAKAEQGIVREVLVPGEMNLHATHYMIQKLFGWQNSHLHNFSLNLKDFEETTDGELVEEYLKLCGTLYKFPSGDLDDRFWDDDYVEGVSIKSWLRSKYCYRYIDYAVENAWVRNQEHAANLRNRFKKEMKRNPYMTLEQLSERIMFDDNFNTVLESIRVRNLFKTAYPEQLIFATSTWRGLQAALIQDMEAQQEEYKKEDPEAFEEFLNIMQDLKDMRKNILNVDKAIRYGQAKEVEEFYKMDPIKVLREQKMMVQKMEYAMQETLSEGNPRLMPFAEELYYSYDYGDDWCVKITCVESYTASDNYDLSYSKQWQEIGGVKIVPKRIPVSKLTYTDRMGNQIEDKNLWEQIQYVYIQKKPLCVMADGLDVMDDVGGIYGYIEFLKTISGKDLEEKADMLTWAKGMGWTGRKKKPENIL